MKKQASKRFGGSSGVSVRAISNGNGYFEKHYPVRIQGVPMSVPAAIRLEDARRLHKRLGEALAYLEQHGA